MSCESRPKIYHGSDEILEIETAYTAGSSAGIVFDDAIEAVVDMVIDGEIVDSYSKTAGTVVEGSTETTFRWLILSTQTAVWPEGKLTAQVSITVENEDFPDNEQKIVFKLYMADVEAVAE